MSEHKKYAIRAAMVAWTSLGFFRGINSYNYEYKNSSNTKTKLYTVRFVYGVGGSLIYICPFLLPVAAVKEIYRAEVVLRGLGEHKKSRYYNEVI
jgi:hypothetical protein